MLLNNISIEDFHWTNLEDINIIDEYKLERLIMNVSPLFFPAQRALI